MINKNTAMSLIFSYNFLERTCDTVDKYVSRYAGTFGLMYDQTEDLTEKIIDLIQRKKCLINLKLFIDIGISRCSLKSKKILVLMSQFEYSLENLRELYDVSERTAYRYMKRAVDELVDNCNSQAIDFDIDYILLQEKWIKQLANTYKMSRDESSEAFEPVH